MQELRGELTWDAPNRKLKVKGTIYIDGSVKAEKSWAARSAATYEGQGSIYMSGSFLLKNAKLCAVVSGNDCDVSGDDPDDPNDGFWDPNKNALIIVAKSRFRRRLTGGLGKQQRRGQELAIPGRAQRRARHRQRDDVGRPGPDHQYGTRRLPQPDVRRLLSRHHFPPSGAPGNPPPPSILLEPREFEGG